MRLTSFSDTCRKWPVLIFLADLALTAPAWGDDPAQIEQQREQQQSEQQLQRFDWEQQQAGRRKDETLP